MAECTLPPADFLRQLFDYDPATGLIKWRVRPRDHFASDGACSRWNKLFPGKNAGRFTGGYLCIGIYSVYFRATRLIYKLMTGADPNGVIDHINRTPQDNRWANLRVCSRAQNCKNKNSQLNATGLSGVRRRHAGRFEAQICHNYKKMHLGSFRTAEDAHAAYVAASIRLFGEHSPYFKK